MQILARSSGVELSSYLRHYLERRLGFALERFEPRILEVRVRLEDVNGPRGGPDKSCSIEVRFRPKGSLRVHHLDTGVREAVNGAAEKLQQQVTRHLKRLHDRRTGRLARRVKPSAA